MSVGPICYREIAAYQALTHASLSAWEVRLIRRLDTAVRLISAKGGQDKAVPISDGKGILAMFRARHGQPKSTPTDRRRT